MGGYVGLDEKGRNGLSAYEIAVLYGFVGTEMDWLNSFGGKQGKEYIQNADSNIKWSPIQFDGHVLNSTLTSNRLLYIPIIVNSDLIFTKIGLRITTAGNLSSIVRLGLYSSNNFLPENLLFQTGNISCNTDGYKEETVPGFSLDKGKLYFLAFLPGGAAFHTFNIFATAVHNILGANTQGSSFCSSYFSDIGAWTEMPSTSGVITPGTGGIPVIFLYP